MMIGVQMLHEDDRKAGVRGQFGEEPFENFQASRRSPNPNHRYGHLDVRRLDLGGDFCNRFLGQIIQLSKAGCNGWDRTGCRERLALS